MSLYALCVCRFHFEQQQHATPPPKKLNRTSSIPIILRERGASTPNAMSMPLLFLGTFKKLNKQELFCSVFLFSFLFVFIFSFLKGVSVLGYLTVLLSHLVFAHCHSVSGYVCLSMCCLGTQIIISLVADWVHFPFH